MNREELLGKAQEVFFEAMLQGYANPNISKGTIPSILGSKIIPFEKENFKVIDAYLTHPNSIRSTGVTIILYENQPIWVMHYHGRYQEEAIPFLKDVLHTAYHKAYFSGGRGINPSENNSFLYINRIEENLFSSFRGKEEIYKHDGSLLGFHEYFGGSLL